MLPGRGACQQYRLRLDDEYRVIIPTHFSKLTAEYLERVTRQYNFSERDGFIVHDEMRLFDLRTREMELHRVRFDSRSSVHSMVKYVEFSNVFKVADAAAKYLIFIADNTLLVEDGAAVGGVVNAGAGGATKLVLNKIPVEIATVYFNKALSFVPCFKYADSDDVILFTSRNVHYLVDAGGQFNDNYYGRLMQGRGGGRAFLSLRLIGLFSLFVGMSWYRRLLACTRLALS